MFLYFLTVFLKSSFLDIFDNIFNTTQLNTNKEKKLVIKVEELNKRFTYPFNYKKYNITDRDWREGKVCITLPSTTSIGEFINKSNVLNTTAFLANESSKESSTINNQSFSIESRGMNFSNGFLLELTVSAKSKEALLRFYSKSISFSELHGCIVNLVPKLKNDEINYSELIDELSKEMNEGNENEEEFELQMKFYN